MRATDLLMDLRFWVILAIALSLLMEPLDIDSSTLIVIALMIQMTLSLDGLTISREDFAEHGGGAVMSVLLCYVLNTAITLLFGLIYIESNPDIWHGWVMLASMPCAISVVTAAILVRGNVGAAVMGVTATYAAGIVLTPLVSFMLLGDAVNPLEILKYIVLFIIIPVVVSRPLKYLQLSRTAKVPVINVMMALMVFFSVNSNHAYIMDNVSFVLSIAAVVIVRIAVLHLVTRYVVRSIGFGKDTYTVYLVMGVWKNTGLSVSMAMILLAPESVIPCFLAIIFETLWFSIVTRDRGSDNSAESASPMR